MAAALTGVEGTAKIATPASPDGKAAAVLLPYTAWQRIKSSS
jgi:hypothetical protein